MDIMIVRGSAFPGVPKYFTINGIKAEVEDFGWKNNNGNLKENDTHFVRKAPTDEVLVKYSINPKEFNIVCDELENVLCYHCSLCY